MSCFRAISGKSFAVVFSVRLFAIYNYLLPLFISASAFYNSRISLFFFSFFLPFAARVFQMQRSAVALDPPA